MSKRRTVTIKSGGWSARARTVPRPRGTVLFVSGWGAGYPTFKKVARSLERDRINTVRAAIPGCAGTKPLGDSAFDALGTGLAEMAQEVSADVLVAHSLGAPIAIEAAYQGGFAGPMLLIGPALDVLPDQGASEILGRVEPLVMFFGATHTDLYRAAIRSARAYEAAPAFMQAAALKFVRVLKPYTRDSEIRALARSNAKDLRRLDRQWTEYLNSAPGVTERLRNAGNTTGLLYAGDDDPVTQATADALEASPNVSRLPVVSGAEHSIASMPKEVIINHIRELLPRR